ncbi:MAG: 30S ribosomal protein S12 methylthiotransferase RimO [Coriobacteriia bacterium]|nr:30S ribosomal protein S12 methylthiotransferase RimO [Coriobacteriia bacterium]
MIRIGFITLGCPKNEADTARMRTLIDASGYEYVDHIEEADIAIINTCGFITSATEESLECIFEMVREWLPQDRSRHVVVTGCLASRYGDDLSDELEEVSLCLSVKDEDDLIAHLDALTGSNYSTDPSDNTGSVRTAHGPSEYVMIADGCDRKCSFCTIPSIRGPYTSRPIDQIAAEVRGLVATGAREIVLVAQDTGRYGKDLESEVTLVDLIDTLADIEDLRWLRIMYVQPDGLTDELLDCYERHEKVCRYFEIPLQHSSGRILKEMGRTGDGIRFLDMIDTIRSRFPDAVIRTTLIVGYPSETQEEFNQLSEFIRHAHFDYVGVFAYSPEDGTIAAKCEDKIDERTRSTRANELQEIAEEICFERMDRWIDRVVEVMIEGHDEEGLWQGRFFGQAPDIDGIVTLRTNGDDVLESGMIVPIRIDDTFLYDLEGERVE